MSSHNLYKGWSEDQLITVLENLYKIEKEVSEAHLFKNLLQTQSHISWTAKFGIDVDWIEVRKCATGLGVFATVDIPGNQYVTIYPTHYIKVEDEEMIGPMHKRAQNGGRAEGIQQDLETVIYGDICVYDNLWFCGHMLNDPCVDVDVKPGKEVEWFVRYVLAADVKSNVKLSKEKLEQSDLVWSMVKTTRAIECGEQLLMPYGPQYWMTAAVYEKVKPKLRQHICDLSEKKREFFLPKLKTAVSSSDYHYFVS